MKLMVRVFAILGGLAIVMIGAILVIPADSIARNLATRFEHQTGRTLDIGGPVRLTVWPDVALGIENITLANAPWSDQGPMVRARRLSVGIDLGALFTGTVQVKNLELIEPVVLLERAADGATNWHLAHPAEGATQTPGATRNEPAHQRPATPARTMLPLRLDRGRITDASVIFVDHRANRMHRIQAIDLQVQAGPDDGEDTVRGSMVYNTAKVAFDLAADDMQRLLSGQVASVRAALESTGTKMRLSGQAGLAPPVFQGELDIESSAPAHLFQAIGRPAPFIPHGLGCEKIALGADLTLAPEGSVHLRALNMTLDTNHLDGKADIFTRDGPRLRVIAGLTAANTLRLQNTCSVPRTHRETHDDVRTPVAIADDAGWSKTPIPTHALRLVDADIQVRTGALDLGATRLFSKAATRLHLDDGRLVAHVDPLALYGGHVTGTVVVNGRGGLSSRVNLEFSKIEAAAALNALTGFDRLAAGNVDGGIDALAIGNSVAALMGSLQGKGHFSMGPGEITGLDLPRMLRTLDGGLNGQNGKTIFDAMSGTFSLEQGVLTNRDLDLKAPLAAATGGGKVDIGARSLDYELRPMVRLDTDTPGVEVPIAITGPWSDIRFQPDFSHVLKERLRIETRALEERARQTARQKLVDELDVAPDALENQDAVKDALGRRLKGKIGETLKGLLGDRR